MFNDNGSHMLALFEFFIFFAWIMCVFYVFADIFRSHDMGGGAKTCPSSTSRVGDRSRMGCEGLELVGVGCLED